MATALMTKDAYQYFGSRFSAQWGIFKNGRPVVTADSVISQEFRKEFIISDFPLEQGAFESYDKVQIPYNVRFRFSAGGSEANRTALLQSVDAIAGDLNLYDAASPEKIYLSCNVTHYDYRRTAINGVGLIIVDVWLEEVRIVSSANSTTLMPSGMATGAIHFPFGADAINDGSVQPVGGGTGSLPLFT